jgi:hypothetical protein
MAQVYQTCMDTIVPQSQAYDEATVKEGLTFICRYISGPDTWTEQQRIFRCSECRRSRFGRAPARNGSSRASRA